MDISASRRQFLQNMTAIGAAGSVSVAAGTPKSLAQAQPASPTTDSTRGLPRIQLMVGPGTLPRACSAPIESGGFS